MADFSGVASPGLQYLGQGIAGEKYGYLTVGVEPVGFELRKKAFFYGELQFPNLIENRPAVFLDGKKIYRGGACIFAPALVADSFMYWYAVWYVGGIEWNLTTF